MSNLINYDYRDVINPRSMSHEEILNDLLEFIESQPESKRWRDYFQHSTGATVLELISGVGAFLRYNSMMSLRESSILTARLRSTIYGMCDLGGYPPNRSKGAVLTLTFASDSDVFWNREEPIAQIGGSVAHLVDSQQFNIGINKAEVVLGEWISLEVISETSSPFSEFKFKADGIGGESGVEKVDEIDNTYFEVWVNGEQIVWTRYVELLGLSENGSRISTNPSINTNPLEAKDKVADVLIKTLNHQISLIFGSENLGRIAKINDKIEIRYIAVDPTQINARVYRLENVVISNSRHFESKALELETPYYPEDDLLKLTTLLPSYQSAQRRMVNKNDHEVMVRSYTGMVDAKWMYGRCYTEDGNEVRGVRQEYDCSKAGQTWEGETEHCCQASIAYLFHDGHIMSREEKGRVLRYLDEFQMLGESIMFVDPKRMTLNLVCDIVVREGEDTDKITAKVKRVIDLYTFKLGLDFKIMDIVNTIHEFPEVKYMYVRMPTEDLQLFYYEYLVRGATQIRFTTNQHEIQQWDSESDGAGYAGFSGG